MNHERSILCAPELCHVICMEVGVGLHGGGTQMQMQGILALSSGS